MRPVRIIATVVFVATLAVAGCASRTADQTAAPVSSRPPSVTTTRPTAGSTKTTTTTMATPANATCAISPKEGPAGSRVTLTCRGLAASEQVDAIFGAEVLATTKATAGGEVAASFTVPSGFAGSSSEARRRRGPGACRRPGPRGLRTYTNVC